MIHEMVLQVLDVHQFFLIFQKGRIKDAGHDSLKNIQAKPRKYEQSFLSLECVEWIQTLVDCRGP